MPDFTVNTSLPIPTTQYHKFEILIRHVRLKHKHNMNSKLKNPIIQTVCNCKLN